MADFEEDGTAFRVLADVVTEEEYLISEFRRGKTKAFEQIFVELYGGLTYFAQEIVKDPEAAKDIVTDSMVILWGKNQDFENMRAIKAFMYITIRNACLNLLRRKKLEKSYFGVLKDELDEEVEKNRIMQAIFDAETLAAVNRAIETLPPQARRVMKLTIEGLSSEEIGAAMNVTEQTVRNTRGRARELLKPLLGGNTAALLLLIKLLE